MVSSCSLDGTVACAGVIHLRLGALGKSEMYCLMMGSDFETASEGQAGHIPPNRERHTFDTMKISALAFVAVAVLAVSLAGARPLPTTSSAGERMFSASPF